MKQTAGARTHGHVRALLRRNLPHDGGGAVVAQPHQPLGQPVPRVQPPRLLHPTQCSASSAVGSV